MDSYENIARRAMNNDDYRAGLLAAAEVCRAQGTDLSKPACPSDMAAVYIERLANGETP